MRKHPKGTKLNDGIYSIVADQLRFCVHI